MTDSTQPRVEASKDSSMEVQHKWLVSRDHNVGVEAEIGRLNRDLVHLSQENARLKNKVSALTRRRETLQANIKKVRQELVAARRRNARLVRRVSELEQRPRSLARRLAGRLRRMGR